MLFFSLLFAEMLSLILSNHAHFDCSACGRTRSCFFPEGEDGCRGSGVMFNLLNDSFLDLSMIIAPTGAKYLALGLSTDDVMGNDHVIECSALGQAPFSMKFSYNQQNPVNERIMNHEMISNSYFLDPIYAAHDGTLYCRAIVRISGWQGNPKVFKHESGRHYHLLLAYGGTTQGGISYHSYRVASDVPVGLHDDSLVGNSPVKLRLIKAHAILMIISWLCFVPTGLLFARFLRNSWPLVRPRGVPIWFHVHRVSNICGTLIMVASVLCILFANNWKWTGSGSSAGPWHQWHSMVGLLSILLAWIQPFVSTMRCAPKNPNRMFFNWIHRAIGVVAFTLATTSITIAAAHFDILWPQKALNVTFALAPMVILIVLTIVIPILNGLERYELQYETVEFIRQIIVLICLGLIVADAVGLSCMIGV